MKQILLHLKLKNFLTFLILLLALSLTSIAQTPQYYNYQVNEGTNYFPFGVVAGKEVQWLYQAGNLNQPSPAPSGNITKVYFYMGFSSGTATLTQLTIKMGQGTITDLPSGQIYSGQLDTVFYRASTNVTSVIGQWMSFTLDRPYNYDNTKSLILDVHQCSATNTNLVVCQHAYTGLKRCYINENSCVPAYVGQDANAANFGVDIAPPILWDVPELIYYRFENNVGTTTPNYASAPVGTNPAPILSTTPLGSGGQFDSCLNGSSTPQLANLGGVNTGWNTSMPANWTISFWLGPNIIDGNPSYIFGDPGAGSFRCFYGGAAGVGNILLRGGFTDVLITGVGVTATVVSIVYDGTNIVVYKNGVLFNTFPRTVTASGGTGFRVGSYNTALVSQLCGKLDEFRLYGRALTAAEITGTWNQELPVLLVGINPPSSGVVRDYSLSQNYPNPFNPSTKIAYSIPKAGNVKLVVYDVLGREVRTLVDEFKQAGAYNVRFDALNIASGVYFYTIKSGDFTETKKMTLIK